MRLYIMENWNTKTKKCFVCKKRKPTEDIGGADFKKSGYQLICKECYRKSK